MRKICVVTTTRAEYGIMSRLIERLYSDKDIDLILTVSGMHLSDKFGNTINEINVPVNYKIDIEIEKEPAYSMAVAINKFNDFFKTNLPDLLVILGDRYEAFAIAIAAMLNNIPIAHLYGGETTEGAIDEAIRHSITKMSHIHFTSCEEYRKRVIQLGENPKSVFNVGSLGVENIKRIKLLSKAQLEADISFKFAKKNILVTFHPVTLEKGMAAKQFSELLAAIDQLDSDTNVIFTMPNSDSESNVLYNMISEYVISHKNAKAYKSLGQLRYFSSLCYVDAVVGNSSSGIVEVPSFGIPTVNIGNRQKGRIQAASIINCLPEKNDILNAINEAFKLNKSIIKNPFEGENTLEDIIYVLKNYDLNNIIKKEFYDLDFSL